MGANHDLLADRAGRAIVSKIVNKDSEIKKLIVVQDKLVNIVV